MAEMEVKGGGKGAAKHSTRVDLTPMVDLGFLLITFFMFTTTMASPTAMDLIMPADAEDKKDETKIKESGALSIILGNKNSIFYYEGQLKDPNAVKPSTYKQIRETIINKKRGTDSNDFMVVIKPMPDATYSNTVNILDEMVINEVKRYAIVDPDKSEADLINKKIAEANGEVLPATNEPKK